MSKRFAALAVAGLTVALAAAAPPAHALIGTNDVVPAATLLIPYFEVDLENADGVNTLFSVSNTSASAVLAHVTVWSTWSIPVLDFDIYLTGYDVQSVNLRDVLVSGRLPITADDLLDPTDTISPQGIISQDINFPPESLVGPCANPFAPDFSRNYGDPAISASFQVHLRALLTGQKSPVDGTCAGQNYGDAIARGYVTIDSTNACSIFFPADAGYFANGGIGVAGNRNTLTGDYFWVNPGENFAQGNPAVHVEAAPGVGTAPGAGTYGATFVPGDYTFYGRYVGGTAIDNREPLAATWFARFLNGGGFSGGTDFVVWRDSKFTPGATCAAGPNYGNLFANNIVVFDEAEDFVTVTTGGPSGEPIDPPDCLFCDETQKTSIGAFDQPFDFGMVYLNLNHPTVLDGALGPGYINIAQSWVVVTMDASGRFSVGYDATVIEHVSLEFTGGRVLSPLSPFK